ncbi:hypothetical protein L7F22_036258 [Adiantum nelumboides]|nr:hypothetical protein [Adiantum nelumboides]
MPSLRRLFPPACNAATVRAMGMIDLESNPLVAVSKCPSFGYGISVLRGIHHEARQDTALELGAASLAETSSFEVEELMMDSHSATLQNFTSVAAVEPRGDAASSASGNLQSDRLGVEGSFSGKVGHFARASSEFMTRHDQAQVPKRMCPCGAGVCKVLTAMTVKNAGRRFYKCPLTKTVRDCGFFEWCEGNMGTSLRPASEDRHSGTHSEPFCLCGAGVCVKRTARTERNMGRQFYRCRLGQGKGCSFFKWCDDMVPPSQAASEQCHWCGVDGHRSKDCPFNDQAWKAVSFGLMTPRRQEEKWDCGTCYKCGLPGHWARDCQQFNHGNKGATGPF